MAESTKKAAVSECCAENDLVGQRLGIFLWCLPALALLLGFSWNAARLWLWIPALLVMGGGCVLNARRCGRLHCYVTGPVFLLAAIYLALSALNLWPLRRGIFLLVVFVIAVLACCMELPFGRYKTRAKHR